MMLGLHSEPVQKIAMTVRRDTTILSSKQLTAEESLDSHLRMHFLTTEYNPWLPSLWP